MNIKFQVPSKTISLKSKTEPEQIVAKLKRSRFYSFWVERCIWCSTKICMNNRFAKLRGVVGLLLPRQLIVFGRGRSFYLFSKSKPYLFVARGPLKRSICGTNWVYTGRTAGVVHERVAPLSNLCATRNTLEKYT